MNAKNNIENDEITKLQVSTTLINRFVLFNARESALKSFIRSFTKFMQFFSAF